jgi:hypothetical protein
MPKDFLEFMDRSIVSERSIVKESTPEVDSPARPVVPMRQQSSSSGIRRPASTSSQQSAPLTHTESVSEPKVIYITPPVLQKQTQDVAVSPIGTDHNLFSSTPESGLESPGAVNVYAQRARISH